MSDAFLLAIKVLASLSALYMCLSPSTAMYRVHKLQTTGTASVVPLVALWFCNHIWLLYGYVTDDVFPLMVTYIIGDITSVAFIAVFFRWSPNRSFVVTAVVLTLIVNAAATIYAVLGMRGITNQAQHDVKTAVGCIAIASSVMLYASPFATIKKVIVTKSSESIPFTMVLVGILNNVLWTIYGVLLKDPLLIIPTAFNFVLGCIQVVLYFFYHPKRQKPGAAVAASVQVTTNPPTVLPLVLPGVESEIVSSGATEEISLSTIVVESPSYVQVQTPTAAQQNP